MKKKRATAQLITIAVIIFLCAVLCVSRFVIPFTDKIFTGFANGIQYGLEFKGGVSQVYEIESTADYSNNEKDLMSDSMYKVEKLVADFYGQGNVYQIDDNKIAIEVPSNSISKRVILSSFEMKDANEEDGKTYLTGADIKSAEYQMDGTSHNVVIQFTSEGKDKFADITKTVAAAGGKIYMFFNGDYDTPQEISIDQEITQGYAVISMGSKDQAKDFSAQLNNSQLGVTMSEFGLIESIEPTFSNYQNIMLVVVLLGMMIASILYLSLRYKMVGLISSMCMVLVFVAYTITFSLTNLIFTMSSYFAVVLGLVLAFASMVIYLERAKREFALGKKLILSFKNGYSQSLLLNIDLLVFSLITSVCLLFTCGTSFAFGMTLLMFSIYTAIVSLLLFRLLTKMYLKINPTKGKLINFVVDKSLSEVKDEK